MPRRPLLDGVKMVSIQRNLVYIRLQEGVPVVRCPSSHGRAMLELSHEVHGHACLSEKHSSRSCVMSESHLPAIRFTL